MKLIEVINKLKNRVGKAQEKLSNFLALPDERKATPPARKLVGKYRECTTWADILEVDLKIEQDKLDAYLNADFNKIRQTIKEQTQQFVQDFIAKRVEFAPVILKRNLELRDFHRQQGDYDIDKMLGMKFLKWSDEAQKEIEYILQQPEGYIPGSWNRSFADDVFACKMQILNSKEIAGLQYKDRYQLSKMYKALRLADYDLEAIKQNQISLAKHHYAGSLTKIAFRIQEHGLNWDKLEITTGYLSHNLECMITDGDRTLKCWTILAYGPIVEAHYRFLIKEVRGKK